jgi:branched-chain amino acid transport system permease protein
MLAYSLNLATLICINAILAITLNFIIGYAGIFSVAHAIFFGVGAYTAANVALHFNASLFVAVPAAMAVAAALSLALALPALRVRGEYFVAASLGLQVIGVTIFSEWKSATGGIGGLIGIPPASVLGREVVDPVEFLVLAVVCLVVIVLAADVLVRSSFGRSLKAIRDSESAALAAGKNVALIKTLSVVLSSSLAAVAGALYAFYLSFINVESFTLDTSVLLTAMVIIGGTGTRLGPLVGAALLMLLPGLLSYLWFLPPTEIGSIQQIIYGGAMVLLMIFRPGGIAGSRAKAP